MRLACAESCTGGMVNKLLTDIPGSSIYLLGGVISYANEVKESLLGVSPDTGTVRCCQRGMCTRNGLWVLKQSFMQI